VKARGIPERRERYTVLVVGEGDTEVAFLEYVKSLRDIRGKRSITIESGRGGNPAYAIERARRLAEAREFKQIVVWVDGDQIRSEEHLMELQASARKMELLVSQPCVEGFFLALLEPGKDWSQRSTTEVKNRFHKEYLPEDEKKTRASYEKVFSLQSLEKCRQQRHSGSGAFDLLDRLMTCLLGE